MLPKKPRFNHAAALPLLLSLLFLPSCIRGLKGEFAWRSVYDQDVPDFERNLNQPTSFHFGRERLYFSNRDTIWWIYRIDRKGFVSGDLLAVLYSLSGSPEAVEVDLRQVKIERSADRRIIRQRYNPLPIGEYRLALANRDHPFDQVEFTVVEEEEIKSPSGVMPGDEYTGENETDIVRYSHAESEESERL